MPDCPFKCLFSLLLKILTESSFVGHKVNMVLIEVLSPQGPETNVKITGGTPNMTLQKLANAINRDFCVLKTENFR